MKANVSKKKSKTDWDSLAALKDSDIDTSDIPKIDEDFWANATVRMPLKSKISIRLDTDVLNWFKAQGPKYQTHVNAVLRGYMDAKKSG